MNGELHRCLERTGLVMDLGITVEHDDQRS